MTEKFVFPLKSFYRRLDTDYIFRSRGLVRYDVERTQIHIFHFRGEKDMHGLWKVTSILCGAIIWFVGKIFVSTGSCAFSANTAKSMAIDKIILIFII